MTTHFLAGILFFGLALKSLGYMVRDELVLRSLVVAGMVCDILFYALQPVPILQSVATNTFLVVINVGLIMLIVFERTTLRMSDSAKWLYQHFPTLRPGQFRRVMKHATWHRADGRSEIIAEGVALDRLFFLFAPRFEIEKRGQTYVAHGPAFAGELVFLNGGQSSASVFVPGGSDYVSFDTCGLQQAMQRSAPLNNAMVALFGKDLAAKVANSVPIRPAEPTPPSAPQTPAPVTRSGPGELVSSG